MKYRNVTNIYEFSKIHNLQLSNLMHVLSGKRKQHKGWRFYEDTVAC
jgi:predicted transcriptional regulator